MKKKYYNILIEHFHDETKALNEYTKLVDYARSMLHEQIDLQKEMIGDFVEGNRIAVDSLSDEETIQEALIDGLLEEYEYIDLFKKKKNEGKKKQTLEIDDLYELFDEIAAGEFDYSLENEIYGKAKIVKQVMREFQRKYKFLYQHFEQAYLKLDESIQELKHSDEPEMMIEEYEFDFQIMDTIIELAFDLDLNITNKQYRKIKESMDFCVDLFTRNFESCPINDEETTLLLLEDLPF